MARIVRILFFALALTGLAGELECMATATLADDCTPISCALCSQTIVTAEQIVAPVSAPQTGSAISTTVLAPPSLSFADPTPPPKTRA